MNLSETAFNEYGPLQCVALRPARQAFVADAKIDAEWKDLNYHSRPSLPRAETEYESFRKHLTDAGAEVIELVADAALTLDAIYVRDSLVLTPRGLVLPRMGKPQRRTESAVNGKALAARGFAIAGEITGDGKLEGGDLVWLDRHTLLAGVGYRTNMDGVRQLQALCGPDVAVQAFDMPHYKGKGDVFHLMSVLSPVARDLAVVYLPLMPARLVDLLQQRGLGFVEVPDGEFDSMGCNVLAVAPRKAMMVDGNPETRHRLLAAGVEVFAYRGDEISRKGEGGPTCLTRPLLRG